ncbi:MAG: metalloregulator ArsR/SmtB family transcription factor [Acidiferrobacterales bacterium]|nr:metalloregulator ArsR/SmtB family transcription factor [Acidiferrobacterales bacterium]
MSNVDKIFEALSSTVRRKILAYVSESPLSAGDIAEKFQMSQPAISKHLKILENAELLDKTREGQFIYYEMRKDTLSGALAGYMQQVCPPSRAIKKERRQKKN